MVVPPCHISFCFLIESHLLVLASKALRGRPKVVEELTLVGLVIRKRLHLALKVLIPTLTLSGL